MKTLILGLLAGLLSAPAAAGAGPSIYAIDPVHTRIVFFVDHAGYARSIATASGASGELAFDPEDWTASSVRVSLPVARIDFGDDDWNRRMGGRGFFRSARHPEITFISTDVEQLDQQHARIHGELTLAGHSAPIVLEARLNAIKRNPMTFRQTVGFSGRTTLDRRDFQMGSYPNVIGNEVEVLVEVEAILGRGTVDAAQSTTADVPLDEDEER